MNPITVVVHIRDRSRSRLPPNVTKDLRSLTWIVLRECTADASIETAYSLDGTHVYRRQTDRTQAVPRPRYSRAEHRAVLAHDCEWADVDDSIWEPVDETGHPTGGIGP